VCVRAKKKKKAGYVTALGVERDLKINNKQQTIITNDDK
jgi:hypothetical protein